jgi:hypothetical protein
VDEPDWDWVCKSCDGSLLVGYDDDVAEADDAARARAVCDVSRRRLGPSFTFGCVWH